MKSLYQGIWNLFKADLGLGGIYDDVSGRMYQDNSEASGEYPYIVYFEVSHNAEWQFNEYYEEFVIQFNVFDDDPSREDILDMKANLMSLFDEATPVVTGYSVVHFNREFAQAIRAEKFWMIAVQYRVLLERD